MELTPALTPEEWAHLSFWAEMPHVGPAVAIRGDGFVIVDDDYYTGFSAYTPRRHGVAALALHGQPFGFTRRDVRGLREFVAAIQNRVINPGSTGTMWLESLADRIEALLPPEGVT